MNTTRKYILIIGTFIIVSCSTLPSTIDDDTLVKLERTACFGECPVYTLVIKKDGRVEYEGHEYVFVKGRQTSILKKESVENIEAELVNSKFLKMKSQLDAGSFGCFIVATDHSYIIIEGSLEKRKKAVSTYLGCNSKQVDAVIELAKYIDDVAGTSKWVEESVGNNP